MRGLPGENAARTDADTDASGVRRAPGMVSSLSGKYQTLEFVSPSRQVVRELGRERYGIAFIQPMLGDQSCQEGTADPASDMVTGRD